MLKQKSFITTVVTTALLLSSASFSAAEINVTVADTEGNQIKDAVVYLQATDGQVFTAQPNQEVIDQVNKQFSPQLKVVTKGSVVSFPNKDDIHHHVYSFSEAKRFELPLYEGKTAEPVTFDKTGVVTLGCNIHDWMKAHIVVLDTPYFQQSDADGQATLTDIPAGSYTLNVWHPQARESMLTQEITLEADSKESVTAGVNLKSVIKKRRAPRGRGRRY